MQSFTDEMNSLFKDVDSMFADFDSNNQNSVVWQLTCSQCGQHLDSTKSGHICAKHNSNYGGSTISNSKPFDTDNVLSGIKRHTDYLLLDNVRLSIAKLRVQHQQSTVANSERVKKAIENILLQAEAELSALQLDIFKKE